MARTDGEQHLVQMRKDLAAERERLSALRQTLEHATTRAGTLAGEMERNRLATAAQADLVAEQAEAFAGYLEATAGGRDRERKLRLATREREIAALERRNAAKLRSGGSGPLDLESPPSLDAEDE